MAPTPHRFGEPQLWIGVNLPGGLDRAGTYFDEWFPIAPTAPSFAQGLAHVRQVAGDHGRDPASISGALYFSGAMYLTVSLDENTAIAEARLNSFLERYYDQRSSIRRRRQACYMGPVSGLKGWLDKYAEAGASHLVSRFAGDHKRHLRAVAGLTQKS